MVWSLLCRIPTLNWPFRKRIKEEGCLHRSSQKTAWNGDRRGGLCAGTTTFSVRPRRLSGQQRARHRLQRVRVTWDSRCCFTGTNKAPEFQWLKMTEACFLFTLHVHYRAVCPSGVILEDGAPTIRTGDKALDKALLILVSNQQLEV